MLQFKFLAINLALLFILGCGPSPELLQRMERIEQDESALAAHQAEVEAMHQEAVAMVASSEVADLRAKKALTAAEALKSEVEELRQRYEAEKEAAKKAQTKAGRSPKR